MELLKKVLIGLSFTLLLANFASANELTIGEIMAAQDHHCKPGDVYCGGQCHSDRDHCPGRCNTHIECSRCYYDDRYDRYGSRNCEEVDCHGRIKDRWRERC